MNEKSKSSIMTSAAILHTHGMRNYAIEKIAKSQGPNDQEENALWCDFLECLQEAANATMGINIPDLNQEEVERRK